ncbi:hypothetical protein AAC387_Pa07g0944 [Persea americana]
MVLRDDEEGRVIEIHVNARNKREIPRPVPLVDDVLKPHHQTVHVGVILSMTGTKIIVKGKEKQDWLAEGSILWVTETGSPLGPISEILGPNRYPYYIVRYNSKKDVPAGIRQGTAVSVVAEFANCILNERKIYKKSNYAFSEDQFPNDGKEAEFKKIQQMEKRGKDNWTQGNQQSAGWNKVQVKEGFHRKAQPSAPPSQGFVEGPVGVGQRLFPDQGQQLPHAVPSGSGCYGCSHGVGQTGIDGAPVSLMVQPVGYPEGLPHQLMPQVNVVSSNGMPIQQQHMCPPTGFISNEMTYQQQHIYPPSGFTMNRVAHQQQHMYPYQQQHVCPPNVFAINGMRKQELDNHQHQMFSAFPNEMPIQSKFNPTQMPPFGDLVGPTPRAMNRDHLHHMRFGMGSQHQVHHAHPYGGMDEQGHSNTGQFPPSFTVQGGFSEPQQFNHRRASNRGRRCPRRHSRWNFIGRRH